MGKQFEFADFIDEFKVSFTVFTTQPGHYDDNGKWIDGATNDPIVVDGIILPHSAPGYSDNMKFDPDGVSGEKHRKVYTTIPLKKGSRIEFNGQHFLIDSDKDYSSYADVYIYIAKGVTKI